MLFMVSSLSKLNGYRPGVGASRKRAAKVLAGGFLDGFHNQQQVGVQGALHLLSKTATAGAILGSADGAHFSPDGADVILQIVAIDGLNGFGYLWEETEEGTARGLLQPTVSIDGTVRTNRANPVADHCFQFG
jgi:hypothetical protein